MSVSIPVHHWLTVTSLNSQASYGWDDAYTPQAYIDDVKYLSTHVLCWPRVPELLELGLKFDLIRKLDDIARRVTHTKRPRTILTNPRNPPQGFVLKREHSDSATHVILPKNGRTTGVNDDNGTYRWIAQEVAPLLRKWGEFRVIFVGRVPLYAILTTPKAGKWEWHKCRPYSLKALRCVVL